MSNTIGKNMLLVGSVWGEKDSFKLIPASLDCPFVEGLYDPTTNTMIMIAKDKKEIFHMMDRLDDTGERMRATKPKANGSPYKQERRTVTTFMEHYFLDEKEQVEFIEMFCVNVDKFDYKKFMVKPSDIVVPQKPPIEVVKDIPKDLKVVQ